MRDRPGRAAVPPPWLPPARIVTIPDRGEFFVRHHVHPDPTAPQVVLLHGWTASADLQFVAAYPDLAAHCSFVAIDHRGHGRGLRTVDRFRLEDVADDAAAVARHLELRDVIAVGYSMGGPISLHLTRRHPDLVSGLVVQATALEWRATRRERIVWKLLPFVGATFRSWLFPRALRRSVMSFVADDSPLAPYRDWLAAETMRGAPHAIVQAGRSLSRYDARPWAGGLGVPAAMLITTHDRLVKPYKQRELATALDADVVEVAMDHLGAIAQPERFGSATAELVASVAARASSRSASA